MEEPRRHAILGKHCANIGQLNDSIGPILAQVWPIAGWKPCFFPKGLRSLHTCQVWISCASDLDITFNDSLVLLILKYVPSTLSLSKCRGSNPEGDRW